MQIINEKFNIGDCLHVGDDVNVTAVQRGVTFEITKGKIKAINGRCLIIQNCISDDKGYGKQVWNGGATKMVETQIRQDEIISLHTYGEN